MLVFAQTITTDPHSAWDVFKAIATVLGSISAVIGISVFSAKVFRFINALTDYITVTAPKTVSSMTNMENMLHTAVTNHLSHIQDSSQATLVAVGNLSHGFETLRSDLHDHELSSAELHGELLARVKSASAE